MATSKKTEATTRRLLAERADFDFAEFEGMAFRLQRDVAAKQSGILSNAQTALRSFLQTAGFQTVTFTLQPRPVSPLPANDLGQARR